ncbi:MAG TPA: MFS transporter [Thermomonospora sp.]|nr:MFS transporter [Thermomonospora sp.]
MHRHPPAAEATAAKNPMRRIAVASGTGTLIEAYDFQIYGVAAALVFPKVFFPALGTAAGTVASFATLGVAFVARPLGSIVFGHFGDRLGRKRTLVTTLLLMGFATMLIGMTPTAGQIGVAAPIIITLLRFVQGLAFGGEWAGATLLAAESAPKARRGFYAMFGSFGAAVAICLANATFLVTGLTMSQDAFVDYGWRIPFLLSGVLVGVGLFVRLKIDESAVFEGEMSRRGAAAAPFVEAVKSQPRQFLLGSGVMVMTFALFYLSVGYLAAYGTSVLDLSRTSVLSIGLVSGLVLAVSLVVAAVLSDRVGRRRVIAAAGVAAVVWSLVLFPVLDQGSTVFYAVGVCGTLFIAGVAYGPVSAFIPELFMTRYRYTATGFCYNVSGVIGGAVPSVVAAAIISAYGSFAFGAALAALCMITVVCTLALGETRDYEMDRVEAVVTA